MISGHVEKVRRVEAEELSSMASVQVHCLARVRSSAQSKMAVRMLAADMGCGEREWTSSRPTRRAWVVSSTTTVPELPKHNEGPYLQHASHASSRPRAKPVRAKGSILRLPQGSLGVSSYTLL